MHEHAHLERRDDAWRLVQAVVEAVAGWHPAVRVATRHIDLEREAACDDRVVERTGAAHRYASCLAETAALASSAWATGDPALLPGAVGGSSVLRLRVMRLLEPGRRRTPRLARRAMMASVAALAMAVGLSSRMEPLVAFAEAGAEAAVIEARAIQWPLASDWAHTAEGARPPTAPRVTDVPSPRRSDVQAPAIARSPARRPRRPNRSVRRAARRPNRL